MQCVGNHRVYDNRGYENTDENFIGNLNRIRYRGYYYDVESGMYYLQTRYYDPQIGQFISPDSPKYLAPETINGLNLYAYCGNNPVMNVDPSGTTSELEWILSVVAFVGGAILCFVPGGQGIGVGLLVAGGSMLISNAMSAAGVDGKTASLISSGLNIVAGFALCFTPFAGLGASMIGSGIGGIAGGYLSESLGYSFEIGANIGSIIGGIAGGKLYDAYKFSKIAQQGVIIGKMGEFNTIAQQNGFAYYRGMPGYTTVAKYSPSIANQLGWAHNYHYISNVMKYGGVIYNLGVPLTGSYGKEVALITKYRYLFFVNWW